VLTHGEAGIAMITGILFQVMQLYRICRFAGETTVLKVLLPNIEPHQYFDDRLADTLDALKKNQTADFFTYRIKNQPVVTYKNKRRGRQPKNGQGQKVAVTTDHFSVDLVFNPGAFEKALDRCGYYPLVTNKSCQELPVEAAMKAHKDQYKVEHTNRRAKGSYRLEPIYIHTPQRIEAYLFLFKIALQVVGLIERNARASITSRDRGLDDFMPNKKDYRTPKTEYLLQKFEHVVSGEMQLPDNKTYGFVSELTELQQDILQILDVPAECYTYEYLCSTPPKLAVNLYW
jgi:hypothetical protein